MMKKNFLFCLLLTALLANAGKIVMVDNFDLPDMRVWNFKAPSTAASWSKEMEITKPAGRLFVRFFQKDSLKKIEFSTPGSSKPLWTAKKFDRSTAIKSTPAGQYVFRFSGEGNSGCRVEISARSQYGRMIDWNCSNARITPRAQGALLQANGKNASFYGRCFQLAKNRLYTLALEAESLEPQTVSLVVSKHKVARRVVPFPMEAGKNMTLSAKFQLPADNGNISILFSKDLLVKKLTITDEGDAPEIQTAVKAAASNKKRGGKKAAPKVANDGRFLEQRNEEKEPANPMLKLPVFYRRAPRLVYPDSIPQEYEICSGLNCFGTPGSYVLIYAALHNPGTDREVGICSVSDLLSAKGKIAAGQWEISEIGFSNYPRGKLSSQIIPELILNQSGKALKANGNRMYRFFLKLPAGTAPGRYRGSVNLTCGETALALPLEVSVLPFELMEPANDEFLWSVYSRIQGRPQRFYSGALRDRYFQDMREAGINGLHYSMGNSEAAVKRLQEIRKKHGFTAPPVLYGIRPHQAALKNLGLPVTEKRWFDNAAVRKEYVRLLKIFDGWMKKHGGENWNDYYVSCVDEPFLGQMERAAWENKLAREAGLKTTGTIYQPRFVRTLAPDLDMSINMFINRDPEILQQLKDIQKEFPKLHYWYLGAGAYDNQEGGLMPNRLMAGFGSFRSGVKGHISFTYQNIDPHHEPFRSPLLRGYGMTFPHPEPTPEKVTIFTLEFDGLREGITDYKYLYTLQKLIVQKAGTDAAKRGQAVLDHILKSTTWHDKMTHAQGITAKRDMTNDNMDKLRALAANAITELILEK
ncbi:MAG: hypothetical protein E7054_03320 [Lentisphaerae bacterium]|nr:hypothetical protein [Lentisphaerota bacterium]